MMKQKKFLRRLLSEVKPTLQLKQNGDYFQLVFDKEIAKDPVFAEVLGLDRVQQLLFDMIAARKGTYSLYQEYEADDKVLLEWRTRGQLARSIHYPSEWYR
jgi:hypothetical protein